MTGPILHMTSPFYPPVYFSFVPPPFPSPACYFISLSSPAEPPTPTFWTLRFPSLLAATSWFACSFLIAHQLAWLTRFVSWFCLCYVCLSGLCHFVYGLPVFPYYPIWQGPQSGNLTEINISTSHMYQGNKRLVVCLHCHCPLASKHHEGKCCSVQM